MPPRTSFTTPTAVISYHLFSDTLQHIELSHSVQVNDKLMELLGTCHCQPTSLAVLHCPNVTDKGIEALGKVTLLVKVKTLTLSGLKGVTGEGIKNVGSRSITELDLSDCNKLKDEGVTSIIQRSVNIEVLNLDSVHKLTDATIVYIAEMLGETLLAEVCKLESLKLSFCHKVLSDTMDILISTAKAKGCLKSLEIMGNSLGRFGCEFLSTCRSLRKLHLAGVQEIDDDYLKMICKELGDTLIELDVSTCLSLTDTAGTHIAKHMKCIEGLGMRNMSPQFTGISLSPLFQDTVRAKNIRYVTFSGTKTISPSVVELIVSNCCSIETLLLAGLRGITDDIITTLAHSCPRLAYCSLRNCSLTNVGVCELAMYCNNLEMLALAGIHELTDKCIIALADNCPHLRELYISGCAKITKASVAYLKDSAIQSVFVKHDIPNAPIGLLMAKDLDTGEYRRMDSEQI